MHVSCALCTRCVLLQCFSFSLSLRFMAVCANHRWPTCLHLECRTLTASSTISRWKGRSEVLTIIREKAKNSLWERPCPDFAQEHKSTKSTLTRLHGNNYWHILLKAKSLCFPVQPEPLGSLSCYSEPRSCQTSQSAAHPGAELSHASEYQQTEQSKTHSFPDPKRFLGYFSVPHQIADPGFFKVILCCSHKSSQSDHIAGSRSFNHGSPST